MRAFFRKVGEECCYAGMAGGMCGVVVLAMHEIFSQCNMPQSKMLVDAGIAALQGIGAYASIRTVDGINWVRRMRHTSRNVLQPR